MSRVSTPVKMLLLLVYIASTVIIGTRAEAGFRLERADPDWKPTGYAAIDSDRWVNQTPVARPVAPRIEARVSAATRLPSLTTARCGGDLPPCWVMRRESGPSGDPNAYNPTGCNGRGCYGKWQCDPNTCDGTGSEAEQDAEARRVWDDGRGCSHWAAC